MTAIVTLAAYDPNDIKPGWIAFWLVVALGVATFLLWRSMNHQLRKINVPPRDDGGPEDASTEDVEGENDGSRDTA